MKIVHIKGSVSDPASENKKKLPMDKDPVFLAALRSQIIEDHNKKIREKKLKQNSAPTSE